MAQVTTLPVLTIPFAFSGLLLPLALLPERCDGSRRHCH
jgi:hypothetical protein